jgi:hypothetical protein
MLPAEIFYWGFSFLKGSLHNVFISCSVLKGLYTTFLPALLGYSILMAMFSGDGGKPQWAV